MIKHIFLYGLPSLRQKSKEYLKNNENTEDILCFWKTMYNAEGIGLAGPQIGLNKRIFVIDIPKESFKKVFINPKIIKYSDNVCGMDEGCLSIPGIYGKVIRPKDIEIEYYDENWNFKKEQYSGLQSRVIQHEYDHLDGILWIDRLSISEALFLMNDLSKIKNRKIKVKYPTL